VAAHDISATMKSPRDKRPGMGGGGFDGVIQIMVTRACDLSCINCTQGSNLAGKPDFMTPEQFETACKSLCSQMGRFIYTPAYFGVVGMFGGNCCLHPQFEELCKIMRRWIPFEQRGLWSNNLMGHGKLCRETFNPEVCNLNVHMSQTAYDEIHRDWPEAKTKGLRIDSRHTPSYVAMKDMEDMTDEERWSLIGNCDVNQRWSALIGVFRGTLRAWFCELAGAQAMLHQNESDYPDTGVEVTPGWWNKPIEAFRSQIEKHCFDCGHPLRGAGDFATTGTREQVSKTHAGIYKLKRPAGKSIQLVTRRSELGETTPISTEYLPLSDLE